MNEDCATKTPLPLAGGAGGGQPGLSTSAAHFKPRNTVRARALRNQATPAERLLWRALSNRKLDGYKFSRQMPVGSYFVDMLCRSAGLVVELDGYSHDLSLDHDRRRKRYLAGAGLTVLRFSNDEVLGNMAGVVQAISAALAKKNPPPTPPASGRGADSNAYGEDEDY